MLPVPDIVREAANPRGGAWDALAQSIREFDADVVVLVARKMPRLVDALRLNLGRQAICVSDQGIPFIHRELWNARVAIVDDVWNVGTTMLRARDRVLRANPRTIRLFALAAKNAEEANSLGVNLTFPNSLTGERYKAVVESVPRALRLVAKPYDADFPIVPCLLKPPFDSWRDAWAWLKSEFGEQVHCTVDEAQLDAGFARATINFNSQFDWMVKARLYFDFNHRSCNFVPMALAPSVPLANDYPAESMSGAIFKALAEPLSGHPSPPTGDDWSEDRDGLARVNTFCDSLLFSASTLASISGLILRGTLAPFSVEDLPMQFGKRAAENCAKLFEGKFRSLPADELQRYIGARRKPKALTNAVLTREERIIGQARKYLHEGLPVLALDSLFAGLGEVVGADNPRAYALSQPYDYATVQREPYLRLRLGFTYQDIQSFFRRNLKERWGHSPVEQLVSALIDLFIDHGAMVPTFTLHDAVCMRIYRKGEANPRWDEEFARLQFLLRSLDDEDREELLGRGRTRIAKINAIMAFSGEVDSSLGVGALERGSVGMLTPSVAERQGGELTGVMRRLGLLN